MHLRRSRFIFNSVVRFSNGKCLITHSICKTNRKKIRMATNCCLCSSSSHRCVVLNDFMTKCTLFLNFFGSTKWNCCYISFRREFASRSMGRSKKEHVHIACSDAHPPTVFFSSMRKRTIETLTRHTRASIAIQLYDHLSGLLILLLCDLCHAFHTRRHFSSVQIQSSEKKWNWMQF